jgi:hypothetical protein
MVETVALTPALGVEVCGISDGAAELHEDTLVVRSRDALRWRSALPADPRS